MTFPISYHRPAQPRRDRALLWLSPALLTAGAMIGHLIEAAWR